MGVNYLFVLLDLLLNFFILLPGPLALLLALLVPLDAAAPHRLVYRLVCAEGWGKPPQGRRIMSHTESFQVGYFKCLMDFSINSYLKKLLTKSVLLRINS